MCMGEHCHKLPWEGGDRPAGGVSEIKDTCYDGPVSLDIYLQDYEGLQPHGA